MRNFLYLLRNNGLTLNNRLNAFDPTISAKCSFCRIVDRDTAPRDSFFNFFYDCKITTRLLQQWCAIFEPPLQINPPLLGSFTGTELIQRKKTDLHQSSLFQILLNMFSGNLSRGKKSLIFRPLLEKCSLLYRQLLTIPKKFVAG